MKKNILIINYLISTLVIGNFLLATTLNAQDTVFIDTEDTTKMIPDYLNVIVIANPTENVIAVQLSTDKKRWTPVEFKSLETKLFSIGSTDTICFIIIKSAGGKSSKRLLYKNHKYKLFWQKEFNKWDIDEI